MKRIFCLFLCVTILLVSPIKVEAKPISEYEEIIYSYEKCINKHDVNQYIGLFSSEIQDEMMTYLKRSGDSIFFAEESIHIKKVEKLDIHVPEMDDKRFEEVMVCHVTVSTTYEKAFKRKTYELKSGLREQDFVLVKENKKWRIYRVSEANNTKSASLETPVEVIVFFTRSENIAFYGEGSSGIYFESYLRDVLPNEWYISSYSPYPHYGYASAMASKMYAWYYTEHPKWDFAPYYACVKDNNSDQKYLIHSYSSMLQKDRNAEDAAIQYISDKALVRSSNGKIFEVHYKTDDGSYHSGQMSASGCLQKAVAGDSYTTILHYYYDNSVYVGTSNTAEVISY